jgi:hypothetical protein
MSKAKIVCKKPEQKDFDGALAYLNLIYPKTRTDRLIGALRTQTHRIGAGIPS